MRTHCGYCGVSIKKFQTRHKQVHPANMATKDHIIPRSRGGGSHGNIMWCCSQCNADKHNLTLNEWRLVLSLRYRTLCVFYFERVFLQCVLYENVYRITSLLSCL